MKSIVCVVYQLFDLNHDKHLFASGWSDTRPWPASWMMAVTNTQADKQAFFHLDQWQWGWGGGKCGGWGKMWLRQRKLYKINKSKGVLYCLWVVEVMSTCLCVTSMSKIPFPAQYTGLALYTSVFFFLTSIKSLTVFFFWQPFFFCKYNY